VRLSGRLKFEAEPFFDGVQARRMQTQQLFDAFELRGEFWLIVLRRIVFRH
jgi:hypothetical protein